MKDFYLSIVLDSETVNCLVGLDVTIPDIVFYNNLFLLLSVKLKLFQIHNAQSKNIQN